MWQQVANVAQLQAIKKNSVKWEAGQMEGQIGASSSYTGQRGGFYEKVWDTEWSPSTEKNSCSDRLGHMFSFLSDLKKTNIFMSGHNITQN